MCRKIVITSGKGGVGKTTLSANLGFALSDLGKSVALIDLDFGLNNLDLLLGVENKIVFDMKDVLEGRCRVKQALIKCFPNKNLYILPSGSLNDNNITGSQIKLMISSLEQIFDYILLDCPAGIDLGFHRAVSCADEGLIIATPSLVSLRDADKALTIIKSYRLKKTGLIINRVRGDLIMSQKMMMPDDIKELLGTELIGVIPEEDQVFLYNCGKLPKNSSSYKAFKLLANNIDKDQSRIFDVTSKYSGFWGSIRRSIKKRV